MEHAMLDCAEHDHDLGRSPDFSSKCPIKDFPQDTASYKPTQPQSPTRFPLLIVLDTNSCLAPFASGDVTPEQDVDLSERPVLHLWNEEP